MHYQDPSLALRDNKDADKQVVIFIKTRCDSSLTQDDRYEDQRHAQRSPVPSGNHPYKPRTERDGPVSTVLLPDASGRIQCSMSLTGHMHPGAIPYSPRFVLPMSNTYSPPYYAMGQSRTGNRQPTAPPDDIQPYRWSRCNGCSLHATWGTHLEALPAHMAGRAGAAASSFPAVNVVLHGPTEYVAGPVRPSKLNRTIQVATGQ
ncbi:hypothetical protein T310_3849 [Rasamsonia emersonii CBS 393.64]|uniref:Uncharacterized protein n=1 Tax=Rasamsonia emersonii (strain ATCC 16479 / CBS 393.64 / IMI 116815) TaxID=1408163 RepID=A0A0F4YV37_RASE3|nr:hypothetical protein T310_3849 [Rasamsonia emersonii CBS 393.64]KKA22109.1 hypothetical protein T310_3849 [Rasamsonia emersonii CBS 393.64]